MIQINSLDDVQKLVENSTEESLYLEYKREITTQGKEVAKDVSAFANTKGGTIIYGIEESGKNSISISWLDVKGTKEKLENMIFSNIEPTIKDIKINPIPNPQNATQAILVVDIPESFEAPHMAGYRYYKRYNHQAAPMEDYEVKDAMFRKGLKKSLDFELTKNIELCNKSTKFANEVYSCPVEQRKHSIFIPFYSIAWNAISNSGLLFVLKENAEKLVEIYSLIHEINYLVECQKYGFEIITTPIHDSRSDTGIYLPSLLQEKISKLRRLINNYQEVE
ncbi:MAG: ATP-binding protein [Methanolobus sp.]|nr:ATP-binding protein [Methanolobus sp.]